MSGNMHKGGPDRSLDQDLESIRTAWQVLHKDEPPELLDQSVRNAARRAVPAGRRSRSLRWLGSLATAAVVVLALAIVIQQDQQGPVPPVPGSDGFRLDDASGAEIRASDAAAVKEKADHTGTVLQRASPAAASESSPPFDGKAAATLLEEQAERDEALLAPEDWVERLMALQQAGRLEELRAELEAFRQAYPGYQLPPGLQE